MKVSNTALDQLKEENYETAQEYCTSCLFNFNGRFIELWTKDKCLLPVSDPKKLGGKYNKKAIAKAAEVLINDEIPFRITPARKRSAARSLINFYELMKEEPPTGLKELSEK